MGVDVHTFGCRLNAAESHAIRAVAERAGQRDLTVVNTCAVTAEATRRSLKATRRMARARPGSPLVVTGCAAEVEPALFAAIPGVTAVLGNGEKLRAEHWATLPAGIVPSRFDGSDGANPAVAAPEDGRTRALLQVQNGCDHRCTFCVIPFGRGPSRSVLPDRVVAEARRLVEDGAREIVLTGVDLTAYGRDLPVPSGLGRLVRAILLAVPALPRLRLSSLDSVEVDRELLEAFGSEPRLMPHLHLSLQAGDDLVLKRMARRHLRADAAAFCREIRRRRPDAVFGADLIAGFPTETEAMFRRSLDLVEDLDLTFLHVFPFSARPGTPAARMPAVPADTIRERAERLREGGRMALLRHLDREVGRTRRVLSEAGGTGRTEGFAPVLFGRSAPAPGEVVDTPIAGHDGRQLLAA